MKVITLGKSIPGAVPLIRVIGFAVLPVSLVYIMSNYLLAKHNSGFMYILMFGMVFQLLLILSVHRTPLMMLAGIGIANTITCLLMLVYIIREHRSSHG
jgi:O-antigen/teichoic acid export membrane protein